MLWRFNQHVSVLASALGTAHACFLSLPANAPGGDFTDPCCTSDIWPPFSQVAFQLTETFTAHSDATAPIGASLALV